MRIFTLFGVALATVMSASAFSPSVTAEAVPNRLSDISGAADVRTPVTAQSVKSQSKFVRGAISKPSPYEKIITEPKNAKSTTLYVHMGYGTSYSWKFGDFGQQTDGFISKMVETEDGKLYFSDMLALYPAEGWVEATKEDDVVSLKLPQLVSVETDKDGKVTRNYLLSLKYEAYDDENDILVPVDPQEYKFKMGRDGSLTPFDPTLVLGQCVWLEADKTGPAGFYYQGNSEQFDNMKVLEEETAEVPEDLVWESDWRRIANNNSYPIFVAVKDDKVYIKQFLYGLVYNNSLNDAVIVGQIEGDKIYFDDKQFLGVGDMNGRARQTCFFRPISPTYSPDGTKLIRVDPVDRLEFKFDREKRWIRSSGDYMITSTNEGKYVYSEHVKRPVFATVDKTADVRWLPAPLIESFALADEVYSTEIKFTVFDFDMDKNLLDTSKIFWNLVIDEEDFIFYDDQYPGVPYEPMIDVPYDCTVAGYISNTRATHWIKVLSEDFESIGVRAVYIDGDKRICSPVAYGNLKFTPGVPDLGDEPDDKRDPYFPESESGIESVESVAPVVSTMWFDLQGRRISVPAQGISVRGEVHEDGTVTFRKVVNR